VVVEVGEQIDRPQALGERMLLGLGLLAGHRSPSARA
jgi:hypothetical protein